MSLHLTLNAPWSRAAMLVFLFIFSIALLLLISSDFLVYALTDEFVRVTSDATPLAFITAPFTEDGVGIHPDTLATVSGYLPNSPRLQRLLAEVDRRGDNPDWTAAETHASNAVRLSPADYRPRLLLGAIQQYQGDIPAAESSVRAALLRAPSSAEAHWQLGSLLLWNGKPEESLDELRIAGEAEQFYFTTGMEMVWTRFEGNVDAVRAIVPAGARYQLALARFLLDKSRPAESAAVFRQIDRDALRGDPDAGHYLDGLIAAGETDLAHDLWSRLADNSASTLMQNGGFESDILLDLAQFDWSIGASSYAQISIDGSTTHGGKRALRIDYLGRETTRLENEIRQRILVRPGARYRLSYAVKAEDLVTPQAPRVAVKSPSGPSGLVVGLSDPAPSGSTDWQPQAFDFTAPAATLTVTIQQRPQYSYEEPTRGTVWFDDFCSKS